MAVVERILRLPDELELLVGQILSKWLGNQLLAITKPPSRDSEDLLQRLRRAYTRLGPCGPYVPKTEHERLILVGARRPRSEAELDTLYGRFGIGLLVETARLQKAYLSTAVRSLAEIPPFPGDLRYLLSLWLRAASPAELETRCRELERWIRQEVEETDEWDALVRSARARNVASESAVKSANGHEQSGPQTAKAGERPTGAPALSPSDLPSPIDVERLGVRSRLERLRIAALIEPESIVKAQQAATQLRDHVEGARELTFSNIDALRSEIDRHISALQEFASALPSREHLATAISDVERLTSEWSDHPRLAGARAWLDKVEDWSGVADIIALASKESFDSLPEWVFRSIAGADAQEPQLAAITSATGRHQLGQLLDWISTLDAGVREVIRTLAPGDGGDAFEQLRDAIRRHDEQRRTERLFEAAAERLGPWVRGSLTSGAEPSIRSADALAALIARLDKLVARAPGLAAELTIQVQATGSLDAAERVLADMAQLYDQIESLHAGLLETFKDLGQLRAIATAISGPKPAEAFKVDLGHCLSEGHGLVQARLVGRPHPSDDGLTITDIPLSLRVGERRDVRIELRVEAPYLDGRKNTWQQIGRKQEIAVDAADFYMADKGTYTATIVLRSVPLMRTRLDQTKPNRWPFKVSFTNGGVEETKEFTFDQVTFERPSFPSLMGDTTSIEDMHRHPLGIQRYFNQLSDTIKSGIASFMVVAPRRFGKTTLLEALKHATIDTDVLAIGPIRALPDEGEGITGAFVRASNALAQELNAHVGTGWQKQELLPPDNAFDQAGEAAFKAGKRAIYLLFDEAQAMFAKKKRGQDAAERLKARLETRWGKSRPGYAPIRLGLVGQPHLFRLIQGQLDALFGGYTYRGVDIAPEEIERLVRERSRGTMQSTREARKLLGDESRSLYVLRVLMQEVQKILVEDHRTWFARADVEQAMQALIRDAVDIPFHTTRSYLRDPLNGSDNQPEWQPVTGYPVAIAWALALSEGARRRTERIERTRSLIDSWAHEIAESSRVPESRIADSLIELKDLEVLDANEQFASELLRRFLAELARGPTPLQVEEERRALQALCVDVIALPELAGLQPIGRGGEAEVYIASIEERDTAIRLVGLPTEAERTAFVEMSAAIRAIEGTRNRSRGYQSLPVTRKIGFTTDRASTGVVLYDFVPGNSLEHRRSQLGRVALIEVGKSIAEALAVLAQRKVIHRDVKPGNIVLNPDGGVPVLVDFGFARLVDSQPVTKFDESDYRAPEIRQKPAQWTPRADVYALALTLRDLAAEGAIDSTLDKLLTRASLADHHKRLTADVFAAELGALSNSARADSIRLNHEAAFTEAIKKLQEHAEIQIATRYLGEMVATAMGIIGRMQAVCSAAQLLQDLFEARYLGRFGAGGPMHDKPVLAHLRPGTFQNTAVSVLCENQTVATGQLRHGHAHRRDTDEKVRAAKRALGVSDDQPLVTAVRQTAVRLEKWSRLSGVADLINAWLVTPR